ncbi:MAG TPA: hypothetical protein VG125_21945, partial [Pirellulales bacterium]|nr:hypothetical protein [Pirellulales bacterium]
MTAIVARPDDSSVHTNPKHKVLMLRCDESPRSGGRSVAAGVSLKFSRLFYGRWRLFGRKICDLSNGRQACVALSWARQGAAPLIHG